MAAGLTVPSWAAQPENSRTLAAVPTQAPNATTHEALLAQCNGPASSLPLEAAPAEAWRQLTAEAAWLNARTLRVGAGVQAAAVAQWRLAHGQGLPEHLRIGQVLDPSVPSWPLQPGPDLQGFGDRALATSHMGRGPVLSLLDHAELADAALRRMHVGPQALLGVDVQGRVVVAERVQSAQALDELYAQAAASTELGVRLKQPAATEWTLWAPTARAVWVCVHGPKGYDARELMAAEQDPASGIWRARLPRDLRGHTYRYLVEVFVPALGWVRNRVTDPYSISLTANSQHSWVGDLADPALAPAGWVGHRRPAAPAHAVDMMISELHVRDFSASDRSVPQALRGKYRAFTQTQSDGMKHLRRMAQAGLRDVHLLPVFDLATVPETGCSSPDERALRAAPADSPQQQALVQAMAGRDCYNWGYDPWHFNAPEGSFATDAHDPAVRIRELRQMVMALHRLGLRVGMDVVYNHMSASGQDPRSVLDRIVPGYYHRLNARGEVERSTCCDNTATEHRMMRRLMIDSAVLWVQHHAIDSFRFDLMGHQPREAMEALQAAVNQAAGRFVPLIGEGWNFGEIADGARFVQASQLSLPGSGIGTFSDRLRDAARGTRHGDDVATTVSRKGWINGAQGPELAEAADLIRAGLAGSIQDMPLTLQGGRTVLARDLPYSGQPAGYVREPGEVVNYVENHDNPTLFDLNAFKLPLETTARERAQIQVLGSALVAWSQGVAYWHAGQEILRSKSMDLNSFDSGDWFNRLDWTLRDNGFAAGLPPGQDSRAFWPVMAPRLAQAHIKPTPEVIRFSRDAHLDLLRVRASTPLLRLPTAQAIRERLSFPGTGPGARADLIAVRLDGRGWPASPHGAVLVVFNAAAQAGHLTLQPQEAAAWVLHPALASPSAADTRLRTQARWVAQESRIEVPPRSAVVFVAP
ncbi:MAG: hypothetical protein RI972_1798 [Pseudomonadota bacterium]